MNSAMEYIAQTGELILNLARQFTFKDAVDVLIVTVLLYSAIKLVRETRAGQLVKGIILLIVLFVISSQIDLLMLNAILRMFLQSGIVIVVVLRNQRSLSCRLPAQSLSVVQVRRSV